MQFEFDEAAALLARTPVSLRGLLADLPGGWVECDEGEGTWNTEQVVGHLIEAERSNWIPRIETLLKHGEKEVFPPFDRFAHLGKRAGSLEEALEEFGEIRAANLVKLRQLVDPEEDLGRRGTHPEFGSVTLQELLSTWVVHDLTHLSQIVRVMAKRYAENVGPWQQYLRILK